MCGMRQNFSRVGDIGMGKLVEGNIHDNLGQV